MSIFSIVGLENAFFVYGVSKMPFCCMGVKMHRGSNLEYCGNFFYTINPVTTSRFTLFGRDRLDRARAWEKSITA